MVELRAGGGEIPVTRDNCVQYIHLLADWRLNTSIEPQFRAFREGLARVVPLSWLRLFNQGELQVCICFCINMCSRVSGCKFVYTSKGNWDEYNTLLASERERTVAKFHSMTCKKALHTFSVVLATQNISEYSAKLEALCTHLLYTCIKSILRYRC